MTPRSPASFALPLALLGACSTLEPIERPVASANLIRSDGSVAGTVQVYPQTTGTLLRIDASGIPAGQHGVHVHAVGRCDTPDFQSAGGHWNPTNNDHGHLDPQGPHIGDLGNVGVGADGRMVTALLVDGATLYQSEGMHALADADGSSLMIHAGADDERTDPSGDSGARIACAVIAPPR